MTNIKLSKENQKTEITVSGHCGSKRVNGIDLCCCAVSVLCMTLAQSLLKLKLPGFLYTVEKGYCTFSFDTDRTKSQKALPVIDTVMNGFYLLKGTYPNNISIENYERRS